MQFSLFLYAQPENARTIIMKIEKGRKENTTPNNRYLGSRKDEECSKM